MSDTIPSGSHQLLDVQAYEEQGQLPVTIIERDAGDKWLIRGRPVFDSDSADDSWTDVWEWNLDGEFVRIPLFPYITSVEPELAMGFAFQIGLQAMYEIGGALTVQHLHVAIGHPVQDRGDHLRFWLGFAVKVKERKP